MALPSPQSFLSMTLRSRLAKLQPLTTPEVSEEEGVVLLTDIKGFSVMVNQFCQRGPSGLEDLTWAMNGYFADVVEIVHRHSGDVTAIAGDSFLCCWRTSSDLPLLEAIARAGQAGLSIQAALHERQAWPGIRFRTRIGIGAGPLTLAFVGGVQGRWECLLGGQAHLAAVRAESLAKPGEVMLSPWAAEAARPIGHAEARTDGHACLIAITQPTPPLPVPSLDVGRDRLHPCVPSAILHRIGLPSPEWLAELRHVTLFLTTLPTLHDLDGRLHAQVERTHQVIQNFQQVVLDYGGTAKVDIDGKGNLLYGLWGLPPHSHADDALRAVEATRALRDSVPGGETLAIGIATGRALCGAFGSERRREYIVRGEVINLAARLMQAAKGNILCDRATMKASGQRMAYEELPALQVKGRPEPVAVVRPFGRRTRQLSGPALMVGREAEHQLLKTALAEWLEENRGSTWLIEAEAGLGKTSLAQALAREARSLGVRVLHGAADSIDRDAAFGAWRGVFEDILAGQDAATKRVALERRLRKLPDLARLAPLASAVVPLDLDDTSLTEEITGEARAEGTKRLLRALLTQVAQEIPTILILEDGHWADTLSRALLADVVEGQPPVLAVVTTRPAKPGQERILPSLERSHVIHLDRLHDAEINKLVCHELGVRRAPRQMLDWIRTRVSGHPYFAVELVRALRSNNSLVVRNGECLVNDLNALDLPATIEGVITERLDQLCPNQQLTLKVAAVIGRVFTERTVCHSHPGKDTNIPQHLSTFVERDLTTPLPSHAQPTYEFRHVLVRDVAYEQMPRVQRRLLHRAVAGWIEGEHKDRLSPVAANLAEHWERAENEERAIHFLELAGEHALRSGAFPEAIHHFDHAMTITSKTPTLVSPERRSRWVVGLGRAAYFLGDLQKCRGLLEQAVRDLDRPLPAAGAATLVGLVQEAMNQARTRVLGLGSKKAHAARREVIETITDCYGLLSQVFFLKGEPSTRLAYLTVRSVNLGERAGESVGFARALSHMGTLLSFLGFKKWSDWYGDWAVRMAQQKGQFAAGAYVRNIEALRLVTNGCHEDALRSNAEALERIVALGDFNLELEAMSVRAMIAATHGQFDVAEPAAHRCVELARKTGSLALGGWALLNLVEAALARDDLPGAQAFLAEGSALLRGLPDVPSRALLARAEALLARYEGRWEDAVRSARAVLHAIGNEPPTAYYIAEAFAAACQILLAGAAAGHPVSRRELKRAARSLRQFARCFWNVRHHAERLEHSLGKLARGCG